MVTAALSCWDSKWKDDAYLLFLGCYLIEKLGQFVFRKMVLKIIAWNDKSVCHFVRNLCFFGAGSRSRKFRVIPLSVSFPKEAQARLHVQKSCTSNWDSQHFKTYSVLGQHSNVLNEAGEWTCHALNSWMFPGCSNVWFISPPPHPNPLKCWGGRCRFCLKLCWSWLHLNPAESAKLTCK